MGASSNETDSGASENSAELGRLAAEMLLKSPFLAMNPTLIPPTAAFAAAAIVGVGLSMQLAGAFMGALQGASDVANRFAAEREGEAAAEAGQPAETAETDGEPNPPAETEAPVAPVVSPLPMAGIATARRKRETRKTVEADDLKRISGIGPKLEQMLNGLGIRGVAQIAVWNDDDIRRIDSALGVEGRVVRDDWVGQAKKLARKAVA